MNPSALVLRHLIFSREGFLLNVDTTFDAGRLTVILGPSGSGKTTLLDLAAGFIKPDNGTIMEGETDVTYLSPEKRKVGVVFQDHALFPHLNIRDNVAYGPFVRGLSRRDALVKAGKFLEMTRISQYAHKKPSSLSGGEKQRVALARALAIEPQILLLDEPFSSLDASLRRSLQKEVRTIQKETCTTTVLVTHDQDEAVSMADLLAVMNDGNIVEMGTPLDLWKKPGELFTALFLGRSTQLEIQKITHPGGRCYIVDTAAGSISVKQEEAISGQPSTLVIRPENLYPSPGGPIGGTVQDVEYAGGLWFVRLAVEGSLYDRIEYTCLNSTIPSPGESIQLNLQPGSGIILSGLNH